MNLDKSTNCKHCHFYHGENNLICANHPFGPSEENYCPDYRALSTSQKFKTIVKNVLNGSFLIIIIGGSLSLASLSLAGSRYSFEWSLLEVSHSSLEAENFNFYLKQVLHETFWQAISCSLFFASVVLVTSLVMFLITLALSEE